MQKLHSAGRFFSLQFILLWCDTTYLSEGFNQMAAVRKIYDQMEPLLGEDYKPFPSYEDLMFRV